MSIASSYIREFNRYVESLMNFFEECPPIDTEVQFSIKIDSLYMDVELSPSGNQWIIQGGATAIVLDRKTLKLLEFTSNFGTLFFFDSKMYYNDKWKTLEDWEAELFQLSTTYDEERPVSLNPLSLLRLVEYNKMRLSL